MASIHKSFGKWRAQVRRKGFPTLTEHFKSKKEAMVSLGLVFRTRR